MPNIANSLNDFLSDSPFAIVLNTEGLYFLLHDAEFRDIVSSSDLVFVDGVGLQKALNICGYRDARRLHGPDLFHEMLHRYDGRRRMVLGGSERAHALLMEKYPKLELSEDRFFCSDYLDPNNMDPVFEMVDSYCPSEIYVCLGIRKQELIGNILRQHYPHVGIVGLGASIDFESGNVRRTSRLMQKAGLEWFFRMIREPRMIPRHARAAIGLLHFVVTHLVKRRNPFGDFNLK